MQKFRSLRQTGHQKFVTNSQRCQFLVSCSQFSLCLLSFFEKLIEVFATTIRQTNCPPPEGVKFRCVKQICLQQKGQWQHQPLGTKTHFPCLSLTLDACIDKWPNEKEVWTKHSTRPAFCFQVTPWSSQHVAQQSWLMQCFQQGADCHLSVCETLCWFVQHIHQESWKHIHICLWLCTMFVDADEHAFQLSCCCLKKLKQSCQCSLSQSKSECQVGGSRQSNKQQCCCHAMSFTQISRGSTLKGLWRQRQSGMWWRTDNLQWKPSNALFWTSQFQLSECCRAWT